MALTGADVGPAIKQSIEVAPTGAALSADIVGVDLSKPVTRDVLSEILAAWRTHLVLRFRDQHLSDPALIRFSRLFGDLDLAPIGSGGKRWAPEFPELVVLSNIIVGGKRMGGMGNYEAAWHTDMSYIDVPPMASVLYALEIPAKGGETGFANMYLAYDKLPADMKAKIEGRRIKHDASYNSVGEIRKGFKEVTDPREAPGAVHPIVRIHPDTGRKCLFLGRRRNACIEGLPLEESESLLDVLWAHATRQEFTWYQEWKVHDLIMWDNRCTLHRRNAFDSAARRLMHRTQIKGTRPN